MNQSLFSTHYLEQVLPGQPEWSSNEHEAAFSDILRLYEREKAFLIPSMKESQIEKRFFRSIFEKLGFEYEVQEDVDSGGEVPDYALFRDREDLDKAHELKATNAFYSKALAVGEVKRWDRELDRFGQDRQDKKNNPTVQICLYLLETRSNWGILSNGRKWRLYHKDRPLNTFYEVDLVALLEDGDIEGFRYFYYFFRKDAFLLSQNRIAFLDFVLNQSEDYARAVGESLKENVYKSLRTLAEGFFEWKENGLSITNQEDLQLVQQNVMRLVYRLLFILFAEGKGLLSDTSYLESDYSLYGLKHEVARKKDSGQPILPTGSSYWTRLGDLFRLIDLGSAESGIPRNQFFVPPYDGGLFDKLKNAFLEDKKIGDCFLADAIDFLARAATGKESQGFVDFSTLEIRHLGSIYEGLLEYRLQVASTRMVAVGKKLTWMTYDEYAKDRKKPTEFARFTKENRAEPGELHLATFKGERKATGSYYTPEPIVRFIVEETVGRVAKERLAEFAQSGRPKRDAILSLRILDPAMGSGHFLVEVVDFLSREFILAIQSDVQSGHIRDEEANQYTLDSVKREVVSHCIYGVDINELAVELAKVSLWLSTISKEKPLSFLDHRLKCGNSLIGAALTDLKRYPEGSLHRNSASTTLPSFISAIFIDNLIGKIKEIESINDDRLENVKRKERVFEEFKMLAEYERTRAIADVYTSVLFGNSVDPTGKKSAKDVYFDLVYSLEYATNWESKTKTRWFQRALEIAKEKSFFHWELEFPEVFFEHGKVRENPGFDVVLGNPPYVSIEKIPKDDLRFFESKYDVATYGRTDLYLLFIELAEILRTPKGYSSFIAPDKWLVSDYGEILRRKFLKRNSIHCIWDLRKEKIFPDATNSPVVFVVGPGTADGLILFEEGLSHGPLPSCHSERFFGLPKARIRIGLSEIEAEICSRVSSQSKSIGEICYVSYGAQPGKLANFVFQSKTDFEKRKVQAGHPNLGSADLKPFLRGRNVQRYFVDYDGDLLAYVPEKLHRPAIPELFEKPKIMFSEICQTLRVAYDDAKYYGNEKVVFCVSFSELQDMPPDVKKDRGIPSLNSKDLAEIEYSMHFLCGLANSRLMRFYYEKIIGDHLNVYPDDVRELPVKSVDWEKDGKRASQVEAFLKKVLGSKAESRVGVTSETLEDCPDNASVLHDMIANLSSRMTSINTQICVESKAFLSWFETWNGSEINEWKSKTKMAQYRSLSFDEFVEILKENSKRPKIDLMARDNLELLQSEFNKSMMLLKPLEQESSRLDTLIDALVYRLYDLGEAEIRMIEDSRLEDVTVANESDE
jgi:type I restriction-modification system DNA methylase subunit